MEAAIFGQAMREYLRPRRFLPWIGLSLLCLFLAIVWTQFEPDASAASRYSTVSSILVFRLLALASAIFTTAIVSQEVEQKTIVYLLTRPVSRPKLLLVRYVASVIVVAVIGIIAAILTSAGAYHGLSGNPLLASDMLALVFGAAAYGAIFLFVSLLFNRALIICLLYAFGWETAIPNMPGEMYRLSTASYLQGIAEHPSEGNNKALALLSGTAGDNVLSRGAATTTLAVVIVVALVLSAIWFTRFEYVPREDAE